MECRLLPSLRDFGHVGFLCTFSTVLSAAAAAGNARSSQLSSSLAGHTVQYVMAGGMARRTECGVVQMAPRRLAVRQARVRFSARHHREVFPTEHTSDEELERGFKEWPG